MKLRKTVVRLLAAVALAASVAAATLGPAGHAGPAHLYAGSPGAPAPLYTDKPGSGGGALARPAIQRTH